MPNRRMIIDYLAIFLLGMSIIGIHYFVARFETIALLGLYSIGFVAYVYLIRSQISLSTVIVTGIVIRLALFFAVPSLSEDVYRFIWDGRMMQQGLHPFALTPDEVMRSGVVFDGLDTSLYALLNSQIYHTIYPPISQLIFWLSTFSDNLLTSITVIRTIVFLFDIGIIVLLYQYFNPLKNANRLVIFALNPLVILELTGNLHFEGIMVFFVLLAIVAIRNHQPVFAGLALALGIGVKFIPLMFLPSLIRRIGGKQIIVIYFVIGMILLLIFFPLLDIQLFWGMSESLRLFFNHFEFNAGLYFLIRELGFLIHGYDVIHTVGPIFSIVALGLILWLSFKKSLKNLELTLLFSMILFIQLSFATTVHPWYIIPLVAMSASSGLIFPIVWSYLIFLTYAGYDVGGYDHPLFLIAIEYLAVIVALVFDYQTTIKKCLNQS